MTASGRRPAQGRDGVSDEIMGERDGGGTRLESLTSSRNIHGGDIHDTLILTLMMIPQKRNDGNNPTRRSVERQFILVDGKLLHKLGQARRQVLSVLVQRRRELLRPRGGVETDGFLERRDRGLGCVWTECRCGRSEASRGGGGDRSSRRTNSARARAQERGNDGSAGHGGDEECQRPTTPNARSS